jgi:hypothetical protein
VRAVSGKGCRRRAHRPAVLLKRWDKLYNEVPTCTSYTSATTGPSPPITHRVHLRTSNAAQLTPHRQHTGRANALAIHQCQSAT